MVDEFPGNSHTKKEKAVAQPSEKKEKKVEPVIQSQVRRQKKSPGKRLSALLFGGDFKDAMSSAFTDTLIPAAKDTMVSFLQELPERVFYGGDVRSRPRRGRPGWTDYAGAAKSPARPGMSHRARMMHEFDEIVIETRPEAETVLDSMLEMFDRFGVVTVADFYDLVNQDSSTADRNWGWSSLQGADVVRARGGGYIISLPRTEALK
jgi:hypothetical protein